MPAVLERPKMTRAMYQALKRHIIRERERKKQAAQEQDALIERIRKERERKRKKEEEDTLTLEQTKEQISHLEEKLEGLKKKKHDFFSQLKKVLHQESETLKRAQLKEQSEMQNLQQQQQQQHYHQHAMQVSGHPSILAPMSRRPTLYQQPHMAQQGQPVNRARSPTPPPTTAYKQPYSDSKYLHGPYAAAKQATMYPPHQSHEFKPTSFPQTQPPHATYPSPAAHTFPQQTVVHTTSQSAHVQPGHATYASPASHSYQQTGNTVYTTAQSAVASGGKYSGPPSQSAFASYPAQFPHGHITKHEAAAFPASSFPLTRMQQPGYLPTQHTTAIPLQQQLEHASQKSGFHEEYKKAQQTPIRAMAPMPVQTAAMMTQPMQLPQQAPSQKGSIVTGYPARGQQQPTSSPVTQYQPVSTAASYVTQQGAGRPAYRGQGQPHGYY